jgi:hypothetical protein
VVALSFAVSLEDEQAPKSKASARAPIANIFFDFISQTSLVGKADKYRRTIPELREGLLISSPLRTLKSIVNNAIDG